MAGAGYKLFTTGQVLTAAEVNTYLQEQVIMVFNDATARTTALSGVLAEGMVSYLKSTKVVEIYNGTAWASLDDPNAIQNTIVDAKGDLIAASAADTPARLAVGSDGSTLVADSSTSTGLRYTAGNALGNPVLNSAFQVWQRGTSILATNSVTAYQADRWQGYSASSNITVSRQATGDTTNLPNIQYCLRAQRTASNSSVGGFAITQNFETSNSIPYVGKTVTLSFYARRGSNFSSTSNLLNCVLGTGTGTDQNWQSGFTNYALAINENATLTTTWQRFSYTATLSSSITQIALNFGYTPTGTAGANDYFEITGVQLDIGSVALPFRTYSATLAGELAAAMRYYQRFGAHDGITTSPYAFYGLGYTYNTTTLRANIELKTRMRIAPTTVEFSALTAGRLDGNNFAVSAVTSEGNNNTDTIASIDCTVATTTTNTLHRLIGNNSTSTFLAFSAEL